MQHSLHEDHPADFSTSSDRKLPPSSSSCCPSWVVATSTVTSVDHLQAGAPAPVGSFFRQLFSEETDEAGDSYVEDLLQLQLPPAAEPPSFDNMMSSSDIFHPRHHSYASSQLQPCVADLPSFSVAESYINSGSSTSAALNIKAESGPHTLEFVNPLISSVLTFQASSSTNITSSIGRSATGTGAACAQLTVPDRQVSPSSDNPLYTDHDGAYHAKSENLVNVDDDGSDELQHTRPQYAAVRSCKKAKLQGSSCSEQLYSSSNSAGTESIVSKVNQSARSKEKLGERINALQQLVSPFGKTDTASVLSEAIGYIKFLQEQVQVLSSPYMKHTNTLTNNSCQDVGVENVSDLRSRGLCLVPVSCTMNVANNNNFNIGADYWASTPSVGGSTPTTRFSASS